MMPWILLGEVVTLSILTALSGQTIFFFIVIGILAIESTRLRL